MRVALMAMTGEGGSPVRLGGRSVPWHQLQAALALGCERIVCIADAPGGELAALQRETEDRGAKFSAIASPRALSGLVSAADTLFAFAPGVFPDREWLTQALGARAGVAALPADTAVERGFERIDRDRAWAGVLSTRGDAVETLGALPPDADPIAGLLRVALQRGARCIDVPDRWLDDGRWALLADETAAKRIEAEWQSRHVPAPSLDRPGEAAAHHVARGLLGRLAGEARAPTAISATGTLLALGGGTAGYLGYTVAGMALLVLGAFALQVGDRLARLARAGSATETGSKGRWSTIRDAIVDISLVAIASSPLEFSGWTAPFAALTTIAAVRLAREDGVPRPVRPFGDRTLALGALLAAAAGGGFVPGMAAFTVAALAARIFWPRKAELTRA